MTQEEVVTTAVSSHDVKVSTTVRDVTSLSLESDKTATRIGGDRKLPANGDKNQVTKNWGIREVEKISLFLIISLASPTWLADVLE